MGDIVRSALVCVSLGGQRAYQQERQQEKEIKGRVEGGENHIDSLRN